MYLPTKYLLWRFFSKNMKKEGEGKDVLSVGAHCNCWEHWGPCLSLWEP